MADGVKVVTATHPIEGGDGGRWSGLRGRSPRAVRGVSKRHACVVIFLICPVFIGLFSVFNFFVCSCYSYIEGVMFL